MPVRETLLDDQRDERSVTVAAAAARLGCDPSTVYELVRTGRLTGHRIGKTDEPRGVRIKLWSIEDWEERHAIGATETPAPPKDAPKRRSRRNAADIEADAFLKSLGA